MADQQRKVSLIFEANTSNAKSNIEALANSINKVMNISTRSTGFSSLDKELSQITVDAAKLESTLKSATNVDTGKLDLSKFNQSLQASNMDLNKYKESLTRLGPAGEQAFTNLARSIMTAESSLRKTNTLLDRFAVSLKNTVQWQISSSLMHGFIGSIQSAMSYAENLNSNLNDIRIVTGQSAEQMAKFAEQANRSAKELNTTTNTYAQASLIFYQQGLSDSEVKRRTDAVIKMANVTGESAKDVSSYMTAIWNNFDNGSKSLEYFEDVITKLGAKTAASSEEIANGLEKFASIGKTIGLSYEYAASMVATIVDKTRQSEDVVGTALKTILARIQGLNLGETLDDGTTLNKYSQALMSVGINIKDTNGELKDMDDILDELGSKWQSLGSDTQVALAQTVGGVRQYNQIMSLMNNWDDFKINVDIALNSEGEVNKQAEIYAESWEAAQKQVQASAEAIYSTLINDKFFIDMNKGFAKVLDQINNFIEGLGGAKGALNALGTLMLTLFSGRIEASIKNIGHGVANMFNPKGEQARLMKTQAAQELSTLRADKGTVGSGAAADLYKQEGQLQLALLDSTKRLSDQELSMVNILMQQYQIRKDQAIAAADNLDEENKAMDIARTRVDLLQQEIALYKNTKDNNNKLSNEAANQVKGILGQDSKVKTATGAIEALDLTNNVNGIQGIAQAKPQIEAFFTEIKEITDKGANATEEDVKRFTEAVNNLSNVEFKGPYLDDFNSKLSALQEGLKNGDISAKDFATKVQELQHSFALGQNDAAQFIQKLADLESVLRANGHTAQADLLRKFLDSLEELEQKSENAGEAAKKLEGHLKNTGMAGDAVKRGLDGAGNSAVQLSTKLTLTARVLSNIAMVINQVRGMIEVFNDDTKSMKEKVLSLITTLGFMAPMLITTVTQIMNTGKAAIGASKGLAAFGKALNASLGVVGWVILGITALISIIALLVDKFKEAENAKLKKLQNQIDDLNKSTESLKEEAKSVEEAFSNYTTVVEKLKECTTGTEEWRDALLDVIEAEQILYDSSPLLADMINNPKLYGIEEGKTEDKEYIHEQYQLVNMAEQAFSSARSTELNREVDLSKLPDLTELENLMFYNYDSYANETGFSPENYFTYRIADYLTDQYSTDSVYDIIDGIFRTYLTNQDYSEEGFLNAVASYIDLSKEDNDGIVLGFLNSLLAPILLGDGSNFTSIEDLSSAVYGAISNPSGNTSFIPLSTYALEHQQVYGIGKTDASMFLPLALEESESFKGIFGEGASEDFYDSELFASMSMTALNRMMKNARENGLIDPFIKGLSDDAIISTISSSDRAIKDFDEDAYVTAFRAGKDYKGIETSLRGEQLYFGLNHEDWLSQWNQLNQEMIQKEAEDGNEFYSKLIQANGNWADAYTVEELPKALDWLKANGIISFTPPTDTFDLKGLDLDNQNALTYSDASKLNRIQANNDSLYGSLVGLLNAEGISGNTAIMSEIMGIDFSTGQTAIDELNKILSDNGISIDSLGESYSGLTGVIMEGHTAIERYATIADGTLQAAKTLSEGGSVTDEETLAAISAAGLDPKVLTSYRGKDVIKDYTDTYVQDLLDSATQQAYKMIETLDENGITDSEERLNSIRQARQEVLDQANLDFISSFGTDYIDFFDQLKREGILDDESYYRYLEQMIRSEAEELGIELEDNFFASYDPSTWLDVFNNSSIQSRWAKGLSSLAEDCVDMVLNGTGAALAQSSMNGEIMTEDQKGQLESIRSMAANLLGVDTELITDEMLADEVFNAILMNIIRDPSVSGFEALKSYGTHKFELPVNMDPEKQAEWYQENYTPSLEARYGYKTAQALQTSDLGSLSYQDMSLAQEALQTDNEYERLSILKNLGYWDENGITDTGRTKFGENATIDDMINSMRDEVSDAMENFNPETMVEEYFGDTFGEEFNNELINLINSQNLSGDKSWDVLHLFDGIDSIEQAKPILTLLQNMGDLSNVNLSSLSGIDWKNTTADEVRRILFESYGLDSKELNDMGLDIEELIDIMNPQDLQEKLGEGLSSLISDGIDIFLDSSLKNIISMAKSGKVLTSEEQKILDNAKEILANLYNIDPELITNEMLTDDVLNLVQEFILNPTSAGFRDIGEALGLSGEQIYELLTSGVVKQYSDKSFLGLKEVLGSETAAQAVKSGDYSQYSTSDLNITAESIGKISGERNRKSFLKELGYIDSEGKFTEKARSYGVEIGQEYNDEIGQAIITGVHDGITGYASANDTETLIKLGNSIAENALNGLFEGIEAPLSIGRTKEIIGLFDGIETSNGAAMLAEALKSVRDLENADLSGLQGIDWDTASVDEVRQAFLLLGSEAADWSDDAIQNLIDSMQNAITYTNKLAEALNNYAGLSDIIQKLKSGEKLSDDEYQQVVEAIGAEKASEAFKLNAKGEWEPEDSYDVDSIVSSLREAQTEDLLSVQEVAQGDNTKYASLAALAKGGTSIGELASRSQSYDGYLTTSGSLQGFVEERGTDIFGADLLEGNEEAFNNVVDALGTGNFEGLEAALEKMGLSISEFFAMVSESAQRQLESSNEAVASQEEVEIDEKIESQGFDVKEIEEYGKYLQEIGKISKDLEDSALKDLTRAIARQERGVENLCNNWEEYADILKDDAKKGTKAYSDTLEDLIKDAEDITDMDLSDFSREFLSSEEALKKFAAAANGGEKEIHDLQDFLTDEQFRLSIKSDDIEVQEELMGELDNIQSILDGQDLTIGTSLDDTGMTEALQELVWMAGSTVEEVEDILSGLGFEPEVTYMEVPVDQITTDKSTGISTWKDDLGNTYTARIDTSLQASEDGMVKIPVINGSKTSFKGSGGTGSHRRRGGGGGGGGGGSRAPQAEKKKEPDKERYHTITNQLEDLTDAYDKVSKAADRAFGKSRIKLLQDQRKELQKLAAAQQSYIDEINDYYKQDLSNLDQVSAYVGFNVQLDENGTITNFDEIQNKMWDEYNSHINDKGEVTDMDEEAWKDYEEEWQRIMDLITKYEETQDLRKEALQQLQDYINEIYDLQLEEVTYSVEIDIDASEYALEILDYLLKQVEDDAWSAAEAIAYMGNQATDFLHQSQTYNSGVADILRNHTKNLTDANGKVLKKATLTEEDIQGYLRGDQASLDKVRDLGLKGEFTDEEIQSLKDYHSQLLAINQSLIDLRNQVYDTLLDSFSSFNEELQDTIDIMEHLTNVTDSYRNIIDLVGKKNVDISNALLESFSQIQTNQARDLVKAQKSRLDDLTKMRDEAEALRQKMLVEGNEKDAEEIEKRIKEMNEQIREATEDYTSALENALQKAEDQFKLHISNIIEDANQAFAGAMGNLQQLQDMFNLKNDTNDMYLEDFEKIYELNKLNRDITNSIDETSNIKAKEELAKLQAEINALEEDGVKVSQYQTEDLRRRYELKLAEIALNEAQNAKSQVQMTRDADGNWNYIYTADENQVAEAEQNYEDKLYELQRANADYINELQDLLIQTEADLAAKIEEITNDQTLSLEEKQALIDQFTAQYVEKFNGYAEELNLVLDNNKILYEDEWTAYSNLTGYKISADENYVDSFNETMLSTLTGFQTAEEFHQNFNDTTEMLLSESDIAFEEWEDNIEEVFEAAGLSSEDLANTLEEQFNNISNESEDLAENIENTGDQAVEAFSNITDAVDNWYQQYSTIIDRVLAQNTALAESFRTLLSAWSDYQAGSGVDDSGDESPTDEENPEEGNDSGGNDNEDEFMGQITIRKGYQYWGYKSPKGGKSNRVKVVNDDRQERTYKFTQLDTSTSRKRVYIPSEGVWVSSYDPDGPKRIKFEKFDTGGYTGSWGGDGRFAMLHEKEIVLNKDDTKNLLSAVGLIRQVAEIIDLNAYSSAGFGSNIASAGSVGTTGTLEQVVHVTAEFPNATNKDEIYAAFGEIVNLASQYANRK